MSFTVLVAPSGFKQSLSVDQAADCIESGVLRAFPGVTIIKAPMVDGGEGFTKALVKATNGTLYNLTVTGPVNDPAEAHFGFLGGSDEPTAVIEMAAAAGLSLVPRDQRNPCLTTSYGVGELVRAALDRGARRILLGCGDSGINDGGAGMAEALGIRFLDGSGDPLPCGGTALSHLATIDISGRDPRLDRVRIDAAVNWHNVLLGERASPASSGHRRAQRQRRWNCSLQPWKDMLQLSKERRASKSALHPDRARPGDWVLRYSASSPANCTHAMISSCSILSWIGSSRRLILSSPRRGNLTGKPHSGRCLPKWPHGRKLLACLSSRSPVPSAKVCATPSRQHSHR